MSGPVTSSGSVVGSSSVTRSMKRVGMPRSVGRFEKLEAMMRTHSSESGGATFALRLWSSFSPDRSAREERSAQPVAQGMGRGQKNGCGAPKSRMAPRAAAKEVRKRGASK